MVYGLVAVRWLLDNHPLTVREFDWNLLPLDSGIRVFVRGYKFMPFRLQIEKPLVVAVILDVKDAIEVNVIECFPMSISMHVIIYTPCTMLIHKTESLLRVGGYEPILVWVPFEVVVFGEESKPVLAIIHKESGIGSIWIIPSDITTEPYELRRM